MHRELHAWIRSIGGEASVFAKMISITFLKIVFIRFKLNMILSTIEMNRPFLKNRREYGIYDTTGLENPGPILAPTTRTVLVTSEITRMSQDDKTRHLNNKQ